jgi:hypothetical protein
MFKMSLFKKVALGIAALAVVAFASVPFVSASQGRDYDTNAVMFGGALNYAELVNKYDHGTGKQYQSSTELQHLYTTLGMGKVYFPKLQEGRVYKDGRVIVNNKVVWTNAESMGRHFMTGSTRDNRFPYPVYWRSTKVSFASESIPAFVYVNDDGKMAFAIIKSCGNPVKGEGVKVPPVKTYNLTVKKFEDKNGNKVKDINESLMQGWKFTVKGNGVDKAITTDRNGSATVTGLKNGTYTVEELAVKDWNCTTGIKRTVVIKDGNVEVWYGNKKQEVIIRTTYLIIAKKFEDVDGDAKHDENEKWIENWSIKLTGNGVSKEYLTNAEGAVTFTGLQAGTYTVTEEQKTGWKNITPLSQTVTVPTSKTIEPIVEFGNQKVKEVIVTPKGEVQQPQPLPVSGPVDAAAGAFGVIGIGGSGAYYLKGKKILASTLKKIK